MVKLPHIISVTHKGQLAAICEWYVYESNVRDKWHLFWWCVFCLVWTAFNWQEFCL